MGNEQETDTSDYAVTGWRAEFVRTFHVSHYKGSWGYLLILTFAVLAVGGTRQRGRLGRRGVGVMGWKGGSLGLWNRPER
jgi:hypothetical protein